MVDKKEPVQPCNLEAAPVLEEDRTGPDNALKYPPEQDSDAHDDSGLHDKLQSPMKQDSDAQVHDKLQYPPEQDSDAHDDSGLHDKFQSPMKQDSDAQVHDKLQSPVEQDSDARDDVGLHDELQSPAEQEPNWMEGLTREVRMRVQRLQEIESQHDEVEKKLYKEIQALVEKYEDSIELLYNERSEIVNGEVDVESNTNETAEEPTSDKKATKVKGIPYFWLTAMKNNKMLAPMIIGSDEEALKYLKDIKCCTIGDLLELKLDFFFDTNPFFTNSILTRTYTEINKCDEITNAPSTGTKINWFPEKSLTREIRPKRKTRLPEKSLTREILPKRYFLTREIRRKRKTRLPKKSLTREIRPKRKTRTEKSVSFFNFFGDCEDGIGHILYNKIIPNAVSWYTGEASETESESSAQEDSDEIESSGDEDENESDGEASKKRTRAGGLTMRKSRRIR